MNQQCQLKHMLYTQFLNEQALGMGTQLAWPQEVGVCTGLYILVALLMKAGFDEQ